MQHARRRWSASTAPSRLRRTAEFRLKPHHSFRRRSESYCNADPTSRAPNVRWRLRTLKSAVTRCVLSQRASRSELNGRPPGWAINLLLAEQPLVGRGGSHSAAIRWRPATGAAAALMGAIRADARQLSGDGAGCLPGSGGRTEPDPTSGDRGHAGTRGRRSGGAGVVHLDDALQGWARAPCSFRVVSAAQVQALAAQLTEVQIRVAADPGSRVADSRIGGRLECASAA